MRVMLLKCHSETPPTESLVSALHLLPMMQLLGKKAVKLLSDKINTDVCEVYVLI